MPDNLTTGAIGSIAAVAFHAVFDVPMRIPLDAFVAVTALGLLMPLRQRPLHFPAFPHEALPERLVMGGLAILCGLALIERPGWKALYLDTLRAESADHPTELLAAISASPAYWYAWRMLAQHILTSKPPASVDGNALGHSAQQRSRLRAVALLALERATELNPASTPLLAELATAQWLEGDRGKARETYWKLFALRPADRTLYTDWLFVEWDARQYAAARRIPAEAESFLATPEDKAALWQALAVLEGRTGSLHRMRDALLRAAEHLPEAPVIVRDIAVCERELGYREAERDTLQKLIKLAPDDARAWWRIAQLEAEAGNAAKVHRALNRAVSLDPRLRKQADQLWRSLAKKPNSKL